MRVYIAFWVWLASSVKGWSTKHHSRFAPSSLDVVHSFAGLAARQTNVCNGTCVECFGEGNINCGTQYCYNPGAGETCCTDGSTWPYCEIGNTCCDDGCCPDVDETQTGTVILPSMTLDSSSSISTASSETTASNMSTSFSSPAIPTAVSTLSLTNTDPELSIAPTTTAYTGIAPVTSSLPAPEQGGSSGIRNYKGFWGSSTCGLLGVLIILCVR